MRSAHREVSPARPWLSQPETDATVRDRRRLHRLRQELVIRMGFALFILAFQLLFHVSSTGESSAVVVLPPLLGPVLNGPYYLAPRGGRWFPAQAHAPLFVHTPP